MAEKKPNVLAEIHVRLEAADLELKINWSPAPAAKRKAAKWLRDIDQKVLPSGKVSIKLSQRSDELTDFIDSGAYWSDGLSELGVEYGAQWIEKFPNWGRGR